MKIQPIGPDRVDDYFALFDNAFEDNPDWAGCYCQFYDDEASDEEWDPSDPEFGARNREKRAATIIDGNAYGLLAYEEGMPVGWINVGPRTSYKNLRTFGQAVEPEDRNVGAIMCFVIHPDHRSQGVATALLDAAHPYLKDLGIEVAEAYPRKAPPSDPDFSWTAAFYKGSAAMYEKAGYLPHREFDLWSVMRKQL